MTVEDRQRFIELLDLFIQDGWKHFLEEVKLNLEAQQQTLEFADGNDVFRAQGATRVFRIIASYEDMVRESLRQAELDEAEEGNETA